MMDDAEIKTPWLFDAPSKTIGLVSLLHLLPGTVKIKINEKKGRTVAAKEAKRAAEQAKHARSAAKKASSAKKANTAATKASAKAKAKAKEQHGRAADTADDDDLLEAEELKNDVKHQDRKSLSNKQNEIEAIMFNVFAWRLVSLLHWFGVADHKAPAEKTHELPPTCSQHVANYYCAQWM